MSKSFKDLRKHIAVSTNEVPDFSTELPYLKKKASYRAMKNKELKSFLKAIEKKDEYLINDALDKILEYCVISIDGKPFDNNELCIQDRTYLLLKVRQASLGDIAKFPHIYKEDAQPVEVTVDISEFPIVYKEESVEEIVQLNDAVRVTLSPVTRATEKELESWIKKNGSKESMIDRRYCAYAALISNVEMLSDDNKEWEHVTLSFEERVKVVEEMCGPTDIENFNKITEKLDFGVKLYFKFKHEDYENEKEEINLLSFFIA